MVFYLVVQQYALECSVNGLDVVFSPDLKVVFLRRQELLGCLLQEGSTLSRVEVTQVGHLVASDLEGLKNNKNKNILKLTYALVKRQVKWNLNYN